MRELENSDLFFASVQFFKLATNHLSARSGTTCQTISEMTFSESFPTTRSAILFMSSSVISGAVAAGAATVGCFAVMFDSS